MWSVNATSQIANSAVLDNFDLDDGNGDEYVNHSLASPDFCKNTLYNSWAPFGDQTMLESNIRDLLRNLMFFSSVSLSALNEPVDPSADYTPPVQMILGMRTAAVLRYKVHYRWWAASLTVTLIIVLMIIPTFWGFWKLRGAATLSPVDTALAFGVPLAQTGHQEIDPRIRLKEIGARTLNSDA